MQGAGLPIRYPAFFIRKLDSRFLECAQPCLEGGGDAVEPGLVADLAIEERLRHRGERVVAVFFVMLAAALFAVARVGDVQALHQGGAAADCECSFSNRFRSPAAAKAIRGDAPDGGRRSIPSNALQSGPRS